MSIDLCLKPEAPRTVAPAIDRFDIFGYHFGFTTPSAIARRLVGRLYQAFTCTGSETPEAVFGLRSICRGAARVWRVSLGVQPLVDCPSLSDALQLLEYEICSRVIAAPGRVILHGATVFTRAGAAFIAGASGAGKTTLALALAVRGYRFGGDDIAFLDPRSGAVQPLPRCAHLDARAWGLLRDAGLRVPSDSIRYNFVTPADLGATSVAATSVRQIIHLSRGTDALPRFEPVTQAETGVVLLSEAGWSGLGATEALVSMQRFTGGATCLRLSRGQLPATVSALSAQLGLP